MNLTDLLTRAPIPAPWAEGEKIPWNDPDFSRRMLKEHLSQKHDAASRRKRIIKQHIHWIQEHILAHKAASILDLGCGPGLYCAELAALGHACHGIDFSPASIGYARKHAPPGCTYTLGDVRTVDYPRDCDLVLFIFGEFNVFKPADTRQILQKARAALRPGGQIVLEISTFDAVEQLGNQPAMWYSAEKGLFSDAPHLCLMESFWDEAQAVATERFWVIEAASEAVHRYAASTQAYAEAEIRSLLTEAGFRGVSVLPSLAGNDSDDADDFWVVSARV